MKALKFKYNGQYYYAVTASYRYIIRQVEDKWDVEIYSGAVLLKSYLGKNTFQEAVNAANGW